MRRSVYRNCLVSIYAVDASLLSRINISHQTLQEKLNKITEAIRRFDRFFPPICNWRVRGWSGYLCTPQTLRLVGHNEGRLFNQTTCPTEGGLWKHPQYTDQRSKSGQCGIAIWSKDQEPGMIIASLSRCVKLKPVFRSFAPRTSPCRVYRKKAGRPKGRPAECFRL